MSTRFAKHNRVVNVHGSYSPTSSPRLDLGGPLLGPLLPIPEASVPNVKKLHHHSRSSSSYSWDRNGDDPQATNYFSSNNSTEPFHHSNSHGHSHSSQYALQQREHEYLLNEHRALTQKHALAQREVISARNHQARLENQIYELDQSLANARKETQRSQRAKREQERQFEQNSSAFERERAMWQEREAELARSLKFATRPLITQPAKDRAYDDKESLPPQIQQQIAENNAAQARALRSQEKLVAELQQQVYTLGQDLLERQRSFSLQDSTLKAELQQAQELHRVLMEENEGYQMLLHEKTMNGEFMQTSIMKSTSYNDDLSAVGLSGSQANGSINLADELGKAFERSPSSPSNSSTLLSTDPPATIESLMEDNRKWKESNNALNLYISKILARIMENPHLQAILAADYSPRRTDTLTSGSSSTPAATGTISTSSSAAGADWNTDLSQANASDPERDSSPSNKKPEVGRARSRSLFGGSFSIRSRPTPSQPVPSHSPFPPPARSSASSNRSRSSSDEDQAGGGKSTLESFQEGHAVENDSPQQVAVESTMDFHNPMYEQLTTFDQPYTRKQLQRHATLGAYDRHQRRQTIGTSPSGGGSSFGGHDRNTSHGRYASDTHSSQGPDNRRSMVTKGKPHSQPHTGLWSTPESTPQSLSLSYSSSSSSSSPSIPPAVAEEVSSPTEAQDQRPVLQDKAGSLSPSLSISTAVSSSTGGVTSTPSTPVYATTTEAGGAWKKIMRRMSMLGGSANGTTTASVAGTMATSVAVPPLSEPAPSDLIAELDACEITSRATEVSVP
ncbi:hypothetical protein BGW38_005323 [Lunasporangiospora selenospora]|uniref:Uncharacterized protein n=1 Tax=Lunasporangiospora selenospora TaxID=979761 RepID=A0A9P6FP02_9FUNG|nr:hypothetical protein BGW38_005323 [Lunasporangiospora selenospora]